jgi:WD40 repeat protein
MKPSFAADEQRLQEIIANFLEACDTGDESDWRTLALEHPDLAEELSSYFADQELLANLAAPLRELFQATTGGSTLVDGPAESRFPPGSKVGDFVIRREIGRGGMGIVYEADQQSLARRVALKVMPKAATLDEQQTRRFRLEAQAASQLQHPHIVPVFEVGSALGLHYYAMQLIDGKSLAVRLAEIRALGGAWPQGNAAPFMGGPGRPGYYAAIAAMGQQAAEALDHAHRRGVVHRDIKPANLLVDEHGHIWITDFGLAKIESAAELTRTGDLVGTLRFMPPERFDGWSDPRSDIYSLGLTLYELLTTQPAFKEQSQERLIQQILRAEPPPPRRLERRVPVDLETIVLKAIAKEPGQRYRTAGELADDLRLFLANRPIKASRVTIVGRGRRWCQRNPLVAGLLGSVAALLIALAVGSSLMASRLADERQNVENERRVAVANLREAYLAQAQGQRHSGQPGRRFKSLEALANAAEIRIGLDLRNEAIACLVLADLRPAKSWQPQSRFANGHPCVAFDARLETYAEADVGGNIVIRRIRDDGEICRLPGAGAEYGAFSLSPDGRYVTLRARNSHAVRVWDVERRRTVDLDMPDGHIAPGAQYYFPGGERTAIGFTDQSIRIYDLSSGNETKRLKFNAPIEALAVHPSGHKVAVIFAQKPQIDIVDVESGSILASYPQPAIVGGMAWHPEGKLLAVVGIIGSYQCHVINTETRRRHATLEGHKSEVVGCAFSQTGDFLVTTSWDKSTILWDTASGRPHTKVAGHFIQIGNDEQHIAYYRPDTGAIGLWDVAAGRECRTFHAPSERHSGPWCVDIHPQGRLMASASDDGARLWDLVTGRELALLPVGNSRTSLFLPSGDLLTYGEFGLQRWPVVEQGTTLQIGPPALVTPRKGWSNYSNAGLSRNGRRLAAVVDQDQAIVLDPEQLGAPVVCGPHEQLAYLRLSPDGKWLATGAQHGSGIKIWDAASGQCVKDIKAGNYGATEFSADSRTLVTWSAGHVPEAWDVGTWQPQPLSDPRWELVAYSRDGATMAVVTPGGILLKDSAGGQELATLAPADLLPVSRLCFSPDGSRLAASCNNFHSIQVWDLHALRRHLRTMNLDWRRQPESPISFPSASPWKVKVVLAATS